MIIIRKFISGVLLVLATCMLFSCNLEDFNLKKLANAEDITPDVFAPLAYGTFNVKDLAIKLSLDDNFQIPADGIDLDSVIISKAITSFRSSAIDSVYLITHFTNNTPADVEFSMSFIDRLTGSPIGNSFTSQKILSGSIDQKIEFKLGIADQDNLQNASDIQFDFKISSPDVTNPVLFKEAKETSFTVKISFHAPTNLWKL